MGDIGAGEEGLSQSPSSWKPVVEIKKDREHRNSSLLSYDRRPAVYYDEDPTPALIKLNINFKGTNGKSNYMHPLKFSPSFITEEIVEQVITIFLLLGYIQDTEVERKYLNYALYSNNEYLHKDKSAVELQLTDGQFLELKFVPQQSVLVKVHLPQFTPTTPPTATFKVTQSTPVRSALKRLYLRFHESDVASYCIARVPASTANDTGVALDQDEFIPHDEAYRFVYRPLVPGDIALANRTLILKVVLRVDPSGEFKRVSMSFDPMECVAKCLRQLDIIAGALDNFGHCALFVTPDEYEERGGYWLKDDLPLSHYQIRTQDLVEYRQRYRTYKVVLPDSRVVYQKFDEYALVSTCADIIKFNEEPLLRSGGVKDFGLYFGNVLLDGDRTLWSYEGAKELVFREHFHPVTVFSADSGQETLMVDFTIVVENILPAIYKKFGVTAAEIQRVTLRKFLTGGELDRTKSLHQQHVRPHDGLLLKVEFSEQQGDETTTRPSSLRVSADPSMAPFEDGNIWDEPRTPDNMVYEGETIEAGTLNKLVERLTSETTHDLEFMKAFLMTYLSFTTPQKLLSKLFERFRVPPGIDPTQKLSIQLRVCNVIKYWVEHHYQDFGHRLTQIVVNFIDHEVSESLPQAAKQVGTAILKRTCGLKSESFRKASEAPLPERTTANNGATTEKSPPSSPLSSSLTSTSPPIANIAAMAHINNHNRTAPSSPTLKGSLPALPPRPANLEKAHSLPDLRRSNSGRPINNSKAKLSSDPRRVSSFDLWRARKGRGSVGPREGLAATSIWDFDEEDIAQQLTISEFEMFAAIKPSELLNQSWNKPALQSRSPNILAMIARFNEIGLWVCHQILQVERLRHRIRRLEKLIKVAEHLKALNNFGTLMAFLGGINNSAILRLKYTKQMLPKRSQDVLEQLEKDMSSEGSYKEYRAILRHTTPPCIPYIGVNLSDLVFIDEGNPDRVANNLVNFSKYQLIYRVIAYLQQFQNTFYTLTPLPHILTFLRNFSTPTEKELYDLSLVREPRGAAKNEVL